MNSKLEFSKRRIKQMKYKLRSYKFKFVIFFTLFTCITILVIGLAALHYIKSGISLFSNAPNKQYLSIMADKLYLKYFISFLLLLLTISIISILAGLKLFKIISKSFVNRIEDITGLAKERIKNYSAIPQSEILRSYIQILKKDQDKLRQYEKVNAWKNGARLLIHEIKNPLTPLKLSTESLYLTAPKELEEEILCANESIKDIENILSSFKNLVNIEYETPYELNFTEFIEEYKKQIKTTYNNDIFISNLSGKTVIILSAESLLKMLFTNLIKNGMEANSTGFNIHLYEKDSYISIKFITKKGYIQDINRCFNFGFSQKGNDRGYGLFLCRQIADYLDIKLWAENYKKDVIFHIKIKKVNNE